MALVKAVFIDECHVFDKWSEIYEYSQSFNHNYGWLLIHKKGKLKTIWNDHYMNSKNIKIKKNGKVVALISVCLCGCFWLMFTMYLIDLATSYTIFCQLILSGMKCFYIWWHVYWKVLLDGENVSFTCYILKWICYLFHFSVFSDFTEIMANEMEPTWDQVKDI